MSESPNRQAVIVGLFVAIGLMILVGGVATIGGLNDQFSERVQVTGTFDDVAGLQAGDNVWFSGVQVGTVREVRFDAQSRVEVEMSIDAAATPFIHQDAQAKIGSDGLIGNTIVVLFGGETGSLGDGTEVSTVEALSTEQMLATLNQNNENILAITHDLKSLSARLAAGEGTAGRLLRDDALYVDVKDAVANLRDASTEAQALTSNLATFSDKLNEPGNLPNQLVTDQATWTALTSSVEQLQEVTASLQESTTGTTGPVGALLNDPQAAQDLRETLDNLNTGTARLSENMEALQHNFLLRGFFKRRNRDRAETIDPASGDGNAEGAACGPRSSYGTD